MSALAQSRNRMTPEEFFAWENEQPERHEFIDGEIYAMTGGTYAHSRISSNLHIALGSRLIHRDCAVHQGDLKVFVDKDFFYPDIIVQCGTSEIEMKSQIAARPILMAEILSSSTEHYDKKEKWLGYQRLPSLQTFLFIAQDKLTIQLFRRRSSEWAYTVHTDLGDLIELSEPALTLPVRELYAGIRGIDPALPPA